MDKLIIDSIRFIKNNNKRPDTFAIFDHIVLNRKKLKVDFTITFHNCKRQINFNLPMKPDTNPVKNDLELCNVSNLLSGFHWIKHKVNHF